MSVTNIRVSLKFDNTAISVGQLVSLDRRIYFEYDNNFLKLHLNISPFALPLKAGIQTMDQNVFEGLPGVFNDSLPDGWGRLLLDRFVRTQGVPPDQLTPLDRLAHVGVHGMGALIYEPQASDQNTVVHESLDGLALHAQQILRGSPDEVLPELLALNGSSAGARPKVMVSVDRKRKKIVCAVDPTLPQWLVKFSNTQEGEDAGAIEYVYSLMAKKAGIHMTETDLFPSKNSAGYFATQRFDRDYKKRFHAHTVAGLLQADFRTATVDYCDLFSLTEKLTKNEQDARQLFRRAVFNVLAHNRDDHLKNFSFIMLPNGEWRLSPAYDLTFSSGPGGEQTTTVLGKGKNISITDLEKLGAYAKLPHREILQCLANVQDALREWPKLAKKHPVTKENIQLISRTFYL